jgi:hypothetical protein
VLFIPRCTGGSAFFFSVFSFSGNNQNLNQMNTQHKSRLMKISWQIQRRRKSSRSKSLASAWAIFLNEDITVFYLVRKHSHQHYENRVEAASLKLF